MNEKAIEAAARALYAHEFGRGSCEFPAWDHETTREGLRERFRWRARAAIDAYTAALPHLRAREEIAQIICERMDDKINRSGKYPCCPELSQCACWGAAEAILSLPAPPVIVEKAKL